MAKDRPIQMWESRLFESDSINLPFSFTDKTDHVNENTFL